MGIVYLLRQVDINGNELFKIGITKNDVKKRIKQLQTGNPNRIDLIYEHYSNNYRLIEQMLHSKFNLNKTLAKNEWFELLNAMVLNFKFICENYEKTIILLKEQNSFFK